MISLYRTLFRQLKREWLGLVFKIHEMLELSRCDAMTKRLDRDERNM